MFARLHGPAYRELAPTLTRLADCEARLGRHEEALRHLEQMLAVRRKLGEPAIHLHERDVKSFGLEEGELAAVFNDTGRLTLRVRVSDDVAPGVALVHKGRWAKLSGGASVNALNPGMRSDMGDSSSVHGTLVQIRRA